MPILIGWLIGVAIGAASAVAIFTALSLTVPGFLGGVSILGSLPPALALILAVFVLVLFYLLGYAIATVSLAGSLPAVAFPLAARALTPGGVPVALPASPGEFFARGLLIGLTAILDSAPLALIPKWGPFIATWAFLVVSLSAVIFVARNRVFHGFLGWSSWLLLMSWVGTAFGFLLFVVNAPFAFAALGIGAFRIDWTTGVIETTGGLSGVTGFVGGFSLGNFNFITPTAVGGSFMAPSLSSHETGHTLNTAAFSGVVLWINALDENIPPLRKLNLAYGELTAESHAQVQPGTARAEFFVRLWA